MLLGMLLQFQNFFCFFVSMTAVDFYSYKWIETNFIVGAKNEINGNQNKNV